MPNAPYADAGQFVDPRHPPDFYVCQMVEWHLLPPNLQDLACPLLGQTSDYDAHIQAVYPWLQLFDEMLVTDHTEWEDVRRLVRVPVSTFPKTFGVPDAMPRIPVGPRETDVFLSGSLLNTYQSDKARLLQQALRASDLKLKLINGFLPPREYWACLAHSKASFTYGRRPGGTPTRGLESLSMGCALVVQSESVLQLFVGEDEGVLTYDADAGNLPTALQRIVRGWADFEPRARRGAEIIRREFSLSRVASQYLRFLTFVAAKPRGPRRRQVPRPLDQRRSVLRYGPIQGEPAVMQRIADANGSRWQTELRTATDPNPINLICRETLLEQASSQDPASALRRDQVIGLVLRLYRDGIRRWPGSLVLRFNMIRAALHFGSPGEVTEALAMAEESADHSPSAWRVQPLEDVFPWDYCSTYFNYRAYLDRVTQACMDGTDPSPELIRLIRAALHHYVGCYSGDLERLRQATILDPGFPYYRLAYAKRLLERGSAEDTVEASALLMDLAENSLVFLEAHAALDALGSRIVGDRHRRIEIAALARRVEEGLHLQAYALPEPLRLARMAPIRPEGEVAVREVSSGFVFLRNQAPLTSHELEIARRMCRDIAELVDGRSAYLEKAGLDPAIYSPAGNWQPENLEGYRQVVSANPEILAHLRLFSQMFTGYRLIDMRSAAGTHVPLALPPNLDRSLEAIARRQDPHAARYAATIAQAPEFLRISPPRKFGEIGWDIDGRIANYDAYVYLERLLLLYEAGLLNPDDPRSLLRRGDVRILEIGGGYGGLAYFLKQVLPQARYAIVDLPESLLFSGVYLSVLFQKEANILLAPDSPPEAPDASGPGFTFVPNHLFPRLREAGSRYDLVINTLSMSEMEEAQVREYCRSLREMLTEQGVFFEQNQDNRGVSHLNACDIVADYFPGRERLSGKFSQGTTQGAAHIWSLRVPADADGPTPAGGGPEPIAALAALPDSRATDENSGRSRQAVEAVCNALPVRSSLHGPEVIREVAGAQEGHSSADACKVSALVSVYKAERFMRGLLEDLERQTIADRLEIVIVDSHSPENERRIVEEFQRRHDNIVYVRTEERENSHVALNRAIRMARGKYVTLANADDRHRPDAFERMLAALEARPEVALVYADSAITDQENGTLDTARILGRMRLPGFDQRLLFRGCCVGPQPMWRRELHARHGEFDPEYEICGDYEFWLRIGVQETFLHLPEVLGLYLMSPTSNERVNRIRRHQETERARRKHWPTAWGALPPWDADYNEMLERPRVGEPVAAESHASRTASGSTPASTPEGESDMAAGHLALERQAWPQACAAFIRVLERDRKCAAARSGLGLGLLALGDAEEGLAQLQEAVRLEPSPDSVSNLACGFIHVGQHAEARQLLEGILAVAPDHAAARTNLDLLSAAGNNGDCGTVSEPAPDAGRAEDLASLLEAAAQQLAGRRWTAAVDGFRRVLELAPDLAEARAALGSALLVLGRTEEAIVELLQAAERLNTSETWNNLGWAEAAACHPEAARAALIKAIQCDPQNLEPQRNLAALFETLEMPGEAQRAYDLILLAAPDDREALAGRARTQAAVASCQDPAGISRRGVGSEDTVLVHG
ncbi:MAG TPA: putative sugar O-methyltransferase [Candidatus Methylomirabilis sp.]|nr:putative sugar O-methyltransferase [Candidatus Methylomirabilis sp.]